jgi:hypothetical protein
MLELKDLFHLPELDSIFEQLADDESGLIVVAGLDVPAASAGASTDADGFLPLGSPHPWEVPGAWGCPAVELLSFAS